MSNGNTSSGNGSVTGTSLGLIELSSIAAGYQVCDAMLKAAGVEIVLARSICSGKYMVMVRGDVAKVQAAVAAGRRAGHISVIDSFVIASLHEAVFPAIAGTNSLEAKEALGILEAFSVASLIEGADAAVKAASVHLLEIRLAMALGGKAFVTLTGSLADVESAIDAGARVVGERGLLVNKVVIAHPRPELLKELL
jgi:microcompartment protein CcmL/EutN